MSKQIAVLMCAINLENQRKLLDGMIQATRENDANLFVFSNYINYRDKEENVQGAYQIMRLPDFHMFDGAIIAKNTIQYQPAADYVVKALQESGIPAASIDLELDGMSYLGVSSYEAELAMVEHFILEHNCDEICYVSGPLFNKEAKKRYCAYQDALERYGYTFGEENVYQGYFTMESGQDIARKMLADGKCPRNIICANDAMAIGMAEVFKEKGLRIPEDVRIAGFDNTELSGQHNPSLTTVNKNQFEVGYRAVYEVLSRMEGNPSKKQYIPCKLEVRRSCGCNREEKVDVEKLKDRYVHQQVLTQNVADIMRNMLADFSGMERPEEAVEALKKYIIQTDMESFYLCLCDKNKLFIQKENDLNGSPDILQTITDYTEKVTIPLAYENGSFGAYGEFYKGMVLPEECRNRSGGNYYVAVPIYYQKCCYGYCVSGNSRFPLEHDLYYSWVMSIGIGFENIRKWVMLHDTVIKLNQMWVYDTMTRLYNRAGFFHYAKPLLEKMQEQEETVFLMFLDIDGLKEVNDTMGHEMGDLLIREMAEVIKQNIAEDRLAMRYGGDEFVIFGRCDREDDLAELVSKVRLQMKIRNERRKNPFELGASIGISSYQAKEISNLDRLIELADKKMYEEKRQKKRQKAESQE